MTGYANTTLTYANTMLSAAESAGYIFKKIKYIKTEEIQYDCKNNGKGYIIGYIYKGYIMVV